ncbi:MAG: hypothetical protein NZ524_06805 [Thiobacillaceae bacterium]|nr:hypothetical protein [Thiobacillaceae bacterium]MDW8324196.1 hypothetical protein [Burkholderiales bacterium]
MEFWEKTIRIRIDEALCASCTSYACVEACERYGREIIMRGPDGRVHLVGDAEETARRGTECLACEYECRMRGRGALSIEVPIEGLDDYRERHGLQAG